jgi:hypothetical protein
VDGLNAQWGAVKLYRSHGFGGLDRGMTISSHSQDTRISVLWALNRLDSKSIQVNGKIEITARRGARYVQGYKAQIIDPESGKVLSSKSGIVDVQWNGDAKPDEFAAVPFHVEFTCPDAIEWEVGKPKLYHLTVSELTAGETRTIPVAFRSFATEGLGNNALFRLNGKRTKIYTSISWGYWGLNGMWPTPELAEKEVKTFCAPMTGWA